MVKFMEEAGERPDLNLYDVFRVTEQWYAANTPNAFWFGAGRNVYQMMLNVLRARDPEIDMCDDTLTGPLRRWSYGHTHHERLALLYETRARLEGVYSPPYTYTGGWLDDMARDAFALAV